MNYRKVIVIVILVYAGFSGSAQNPSFRFAVNTGLFSDELGKADVPHPLIELFSPAEAAENFAMQASPGIEAEVLFPLFEKWFVGVEIESMKLRGYNDAPPLYNYYLTPYSPIDTFVFSPVKFQSSLLNILVNWRYFFSSVSDIKPFVKFSTGVAFIGTDFTFKNPADAESVEMDVLYARGTRNNDNPKWPAFYAGTGLGVDYKISDNLSIQLEGNAIVINSDIVNGVPNFSYVNDEGKELLKYRNRQSLLFQVSAGVKYSLDSDFGLPGRGKEKKGKTGTYLPFYRRK